MQQLQYIAPAATAAESVSQIEESDESESQMALVVNDLGGILHEVRAS